MGESKTYEGGCHCGKVRYRATMEVGKAMACNCSICSKRAHLLTFVGPDQFEQLSGADALTDYQFNKHVIHHLFCGTCGVGSFGRGVGPDGKEMVAINLRCVDGVDTTKLEIQQYDGRSV